MKSERVNGICIRCENIRLSNPGYLIEELDFAYNWGKSNNRPIWLGEFGVTVNADEGSRERWADFFTDEAENRGIT